MQADAIISQLYNNEDFNRCIRTRKKPSWWPGSKYDFWDELKAEVLKILCEQNKSDIERMHNTGQLNFFCARIIVNLAGQSRNVLQKGYIKGAIVEPEKANLTDEIEPIDLQHDEVKLALAKMKAVSSSGYYYATMLEVYAELGSCRSVSKAVGISTMSVWNAVTKARKMFNQYYEN